MDKKNKKMKVFLGVLRVLETIYLLSFFFVIYAHFAIGVEQVHGAIVRLSEAWIQTSYMILPVLLFKNLLEAILNNGILTKEQKLYILMRSAIYVALTIYSYQLILSL